VAFFKILAIKLNKSMKNTLLICITLILTNWALHAQVGIDTTDPQAQLDIRSSNQTTPTNTDGILIPKIDNFPTVNPTLAQDGMLIFLTGEGIPIRGFHYWDITTTAWIPLGSGNTLNQAYNQGGPGAGRFINASNGALEISNGRVELIHTNEATGTTNSGVLEISNSLRLDGNEVVTNTNSELFLQNGNNGDLSIDDTTLFVDASTNRIGIGTFAPNATLDVRGNAIFNQLGGNFDFRIESDTNQNAFFVDASTNRIGMGTAVPNATLDVRGSTIFNQLGGNFDFRVESDRRAYSLFVDASRDVVFIGSNTANVGGLNNNGDTMPNGVVVDYVASFYQGTTNGTAVQLGSTEYIMDSGNLQMSVYGSWLPYYPMSTTAPFSLGNSAQRWNSVWSINGTIQTSDITLKKNIKPLNYGLKEILQLETITYQWKDAKDNKEKIGFSAQQLLDIIPEVVSTHDYEYSADEKTTIKTKNKNLGVFYSDIIPVLTKAIQEQQKTIELLNEKLKRIDRFEKDLKELKKQKTKS